MTTEQKVEGGERQDAYEQNLRDLELIRTDPAWALTAVQEWRKLSAALQASREETRRLREALQKARPYVVEHGPPGTSIETTEESAERSAALLAEIDEVLASPAPDRPEGEA